MRPLSYSQISRYRACPLSYKLQYIDKLKRVERFYLSFGDIIHQCAEYFFDIPVPPPPSFEKLLHFYEINWISEGYESPLQEQRYKAYGKQLLRDFWRIHAANFRMPLAVEYSFSVKVDGVALAGKIDRVDRLADGVSIVDYKTSQRPFTMEQVENDLQLTFYQLAAETTWRLPVKRLTLYHLRSNIPFSSDGRKPERLAEARRIVLEVAEGIARQDFPAVENQFCDYCDFPQHCPYRKHKYVGEEAVAPAAKDLLNGLVAKDAVERYALLQKQKKEIEAELDELKQMVCQYCDVNGYNRLYGQEHALTYRFVSRNGFPEEAVKALLEPAGLWPRVLKFDSSLVKALLEEEELAPELHRLLVALKQVKTTFPMLTVKRLDEDGEDR